MASSETNQIGELRMTRATTPPSKKDSQAEVHSTASDAEHELDTRLLVHDLIATQTVPFVAMLRAMIMEKRIVEGGNALNEEDLERHGSIHLEALIKESLDLSNGVAKLKGKVKTILNYSTESSRYLPLPISLGDKPPSKHGFERTGTKPFMSLTLMENQDGTLKRTRRHELESFIWNFAWIIEGNKSKERWSWDHPSFLQAAQLKRRYWATRFIPYKHPKAIKPSDKDFWEALCMVRYHWDNLANREMFFSFCAPEAEFVQIVEQGFPRESVDRTWDWSTFNASRT